MSESTIFYQNYTSIVQTTAILLVICRQWHPATASLVLGCHPTGHAT